MLLPLAIAAFLVVLIFFSKRARQSQLGPRPFILPFRLPFGIDCAVRAVSHLLRHDFVEWTQDMLDRPGGTIEMYLAGTSLVLTDDCENIKAIMFSQFAEFGKGDFMHEVFANVFGDSVFSTDGKIWMENKNELRPHLSNSRPTDVATTETHIQTFLGHLDNGGKPVEIYDLVDRLQLDIATDIFLGHSALTLEGEQQPFRDALNTLMAVNTVRMLIGPLALWSPDRLLAPVASRDMNRYMDKQIDKTLSLPRQELLEREGKLTLMETLALKTRDRKYIKNQLVAILLAGKDPVAITISWALYELACHPDVAQRLREEVVRVCGIERTPSADNLKEMLLLKYIIRETLRLYHPLGFNIREAQRNTTIPTGGGPRGDQPVTILKGERVAYSVIGLQRRKDLVGPDAGDWKPDRYFHWTPKTWEFIPFNHGPRICLGRVFGYFQMEYTLCRIFQRFERIELHEPRAQRIKVELNTKMAYPINCSFHRAA